MPLGWHAQTSFKGMKMKLTNVLILITVCFMEFVLTSCSTSATAWKEKKIEAQMERIGEVPEKDRRQNIQCLSEQEYLIATTEHIWRTLNGGKTWRLIYPMNTSENEIKIEIQDFQFINSLVGWVVTSGGIFKTEDGGKTWVRCLIPLLDYPQGLALKIRFFTNLKQGWVVGGIYRHVSDKELERGFPNNAVSFDGKSVLHAAVFHTTDGGRNWEQQTFPLSIGRIYDINFVDDENGWVIGDVGIFQTKNAGKEWKYVDLEKRGSQEKYLKTTEGDSADPIYLVFSGLHFGWLSYTNGYVAKTTDGGKTWTDLLRPDSVWQSPAYDTFFQKLYFINSSQGWGLGADGSIYETKDSGNAWIKKNTNIKAEDLGFGSNQVFAVSREGLFRLN